MRARCPRLLACLLGLIVVESTHAQEGESTAWQRALLDSVQRNARKRSEAASKQLRAWLEGPAFRSELKACSPEAAALSTGALLERVRREVAVAEVASGFYARGYGNQMTISEGLEGPHFFESSWEVGVRHGSNFSGSHWFNWYDIQDDVETKLYGLRPFARRGKPQNMLEAKERGPYCLANLHRVDVGSPLYGDVTVVLSNELVASSSVVSSVDTGGWTAMCNSSWHVPFPGYAPNCSAYIPYTGLGTMQDFDHLFLANTAYWNVSLSRVMCRLLAPWGHVPISGSDLIHYWEVIPAAELSYPAAIKFVIGSFPDLFGTSVGLKLQEWCTKNGWVLVWSLGLNVGEPPPNFWTAVNLTGPFISNRRLVDPIVLDRTSATFNTSSSSSGDGGRDAAKSGFWAAWHEATELQREAQKANRTVSNSTKAAAWGRLARRMPEELLVSPLSAGACANAENCVGTTSAGDCLCYTRGEAASVLI